MTEAILARDVPCRGCGYNLRGLSPDGRCPECAADVAISLGLSAFSTASRRQFQIADIGTRIILLLCVWEIVFMAVCEGLMFWAPLRSVWPSRYFIDPAWMVVVCLAQNVGLFMFTALGGSARRNVIFALGLILVLMEIPFAIGHRWNVMVNPLAEAFVAVVFYRLWLTHAEYLAIATGQPALIKRFFKWAAPLALSVWFLGFVADLNELMMTLGAAATIVLNAWMILPLARLHMVLERMTPADDTANTPAPALPPPSPQLANADPRWLRRVQEGLVLEALWMAFALVIPILSSGYRRYDFHVYAGGLDLAAWIYAAIVAAQVPIIWRVVALPEDESRCDGISRGSRLRNWARLFVLISLPSALVGLLPGASFSVFHSLFSLSPLLYAGLYFVLFLFIEKDLAVLAGDADLGGQAAMMKWFLPATIIAWPAISFLAVLLVVLLRRSSLGGLDRLIQMLMVLAALWAVWILYQLSRRFGEDGGQARSPSGRG